MYWDRKKKETTLDESEVSLFFFPSSIYIALYFYISSTVLRKNRNTDFPSISIYIYIYIYIYTSNKPRFLGLQCNLRSDPWPMQARSALTIPELKWKTPAIPPPPQFRPLISSYCRHFSRDSNVEVFCASTVTWWLLVTYLLIYFSEEVKVNRLTLPLLSL